MKRRDVSAAFFAAAVGSVAMSEKATAQSSCSSGPCYLQSVWEKAAGVTPSNYGYLPGQPERYISGTVTYAANTAGTVGLAPGNPTPPPPTDFTAAVRTALGIAGQPVIFGPYLYAFNNTNPYITMPNEQKMYGQGIYETGLCFPATAGTSPGNPFISNLTNAAKIELRGFTLYCNSARYCSRGIWLGTPSNPYGTEGYLDQIMVRDLPSQALAFDIYGNVGEFGNLYALNTAGIRIMGSANSVLCLENTNASGFTDTNNNQTGFQFQDGVINAFEYEAPQSNILLMTLCGNAIINVIPSFAASTSFAELFYVVSNAHYAAKNGVINVIQMYYGGSSGSYATYAHGFYDQASASYYGPGNTSSSSSSIALCGVWNYGPQFIKTSLTVWNLPNSNPGTGSKQLWYDPSDSNRVKYQP